MHPITFQHVWKRYHRGAAHDSLRDALPALWKRWSARNGHDEDNGQDPGADGFWALRDVSFEVSKGETMGIVGPNGAGKSTILKLLSRICRQTKGEIQMHGRVAALIELGGGFHADLTGAENIYLKGTMLGFRRAEIARMFDSIVAFSELEPFLQMPVKRYSSGMTVRLGFAIAAQVQPEILLLDEVLAVGDLAFQQKCFRQLAQLKGRGTTLVFVSHNLEAIQKLCDRALWLQEGEALRQGTPAEIVRFYREEAMRHTIKQAAADPLVEGSGAIRITRTMLLDANGAPVTTLKTGEPLRIEVGFQASRPIKRPVFRIAVERLDGLVCHATSSRAAGLKASAVEGEGTVTLEYTALNLLPYHYQVTVSILEDNNPIPLASVRHGCFFQIDSDHQEHGAVHLEHRWGLEPAGRP